MSDRAKMVRNWGVPLHKDSDTDLTESRNNLVCVSNGVKLVGIICDVDAHDDCGGSDGEAIMMTSVAFSFPFHLDTDATESRSVWGNFLIRETS